MVKQIAAWQASDGTVHLTENEAMAADTRAEINTVAERLVEEISPAYSDKEQIKRDLLNAEELLLRLAALLKERARLEE